MVRLTINGRSVEAEEGMTILQAAKSADIEIPSLCYLPDINEIGACRICSVEIEGYDRLAAACVTAVHDDMVVHTNTKRARIARKTNVHLMLSRHDCNCTTCVRSGNCTLQKLAVDLNVLDIPYKEDIPVNRWDMRTPIIRKESKCVQCMRCVQVCEKVQGLGVWEVTGNGSRTTVGVPGNQDMSSAGCTFCGQCVTHCPVGALAARDDTGYLFAALDDPDIITVAQVAPAVRAAWAESFGLDRDFASPERMAAALRMIGFDYVFDTNFTADLTIMEEGSEFVERFKNRGNNKWPMFTSCCPGWVRFVKSQYPELKDHLSTAKSPQQMFGAVTKTFFADRIGVDPRKIFCVSIMPCIAKKTECAMSVMRGDNGDPDVDVVITSREFARMLKMLSVDPSQLPEEDFDSPLGSGTGAAIVFGMTGGVMDAALRSAYYLVTGNNPDADAFKEVRGMEGWKEAVFNIPGAGDVRVAVASGLGNTRRLIEAVKSGEVSYDFVEIMSCPGGCVGGGGQPIKDGFELAGERSQMLTRLDREAQIRYSHENADVIKLYEEFLEKPMSEKSHHLLHTDHSEERLEDKGDRRKGDRRQGDGYPVFYRRS